MVSDNPPSYVMEGFVIWRIWKNIGVDKVVVIKKGIFIMQFRSIEKKDSL